jgi:anti-sigma factor RsiW
VDGELRDEARERVLAHLATCPGCKAAADEQRRLKSAVAQSAAPALSAGFLARLQSLPVCGHDTEPPAGPPGGPGAGSGGPPGLTLGGKRLDGGIFGRLRGHGGQAEYVPAAAAVPAQPTGFPVHGLLRAHREPPAPASRGRRLAFAAAGAVSMAAIALGSALPLEAAMDGGDDPGPAVTPLSAHATAPSGPRRHRPGHPAPGLRPHPRPLRLLRPGLARRPPPPGRRPRRHPVTLALRKGP